MGVDVHTKFDDCQSSLENADNDPDSIIVWAKEQGKKTGISAYYFCHSNSDLGLRYQDLGLIPWDEVEFSLCLLEIFPSDWKRINFECFLNTFSELVSTGKNYAEASLMIANDPRRSGDDNEGDARDTRSPIFPYSQQGLGMRGSNSTECQGEMPRHRQTAHREGTRAIHECPSETSSTYHISKSKHVPCIKTCNLRSSFWNKQYIVAPWPVQRLNDRETFWFETLLRGHGR